jgi:putative aldouronate transport system substrate-binding protein
MKAKSISAMLLAVIMTATAFTGCGVKPESSTPDSKTESSASGDESSTEDSTGEDLLTYADGTVLRMACGYNSDKTGMSFTADLAGEGITLADGKS